MKKNIAIEGRIDLHGLTQEQAYSLLKRRFFEAQSQNKKNILVITGKGSIDRPCVMKLMLPRWIEYTELKQYVVSYRSAPQNLGGEGATIIKIRTL